MKEGADGRAFSGKVETGCPSRNASNVKSATAADARMLLELADNPRG
jgi:hypothetical protein